MKCVLFVRVKQHKNWFLLNLTFFSQFQIYLNDTKVGSKLDRDVLKATLPLKPNRTYKITVQALSSKSQYPDSPHSNCLTLSTAVQMDPNQFINPTTLDVIPGSAFPAGGSGSHENGGNGGLNNAQLIALRIYYEQENEKYFNDPTEQRRISTISSATSLCPLSINSRAVSLLPTPLLPESKIPIPNMFKTVILLIH